MVHLQGKEAGLGWKLLTNDFPLRASWFCLGKLLANQICLTAYTWRDPKLTGHLGRDKLKALFRNVDLGWEGRRKNTL